MKKFILLIATATLITGCSQHIADAACNVWQPLTYRDRPTGPVDTADTIKSVKANNAAWKVYCGS